MKIAICDDEKPFLDKLYQILQEIRMELNIPISIIKFIDGKELLNDRASHSRYFSSDELDAQFFC